MITVGSLFSGVGGIELGFEQAGGFNLKWQVEIDPFCEQILAERWPDVQWYSDVYEVGSNLQDVDLICGGVPCQPVSQAAARSDRGEGWLWHEFKRVIEEKEPEYVVLENPEALRFRGRGLGVVLRDLADLGYNAEWRVLRASDFGAPHPRARIWVVAYTNGDCESVGPLDDEAPFVSKSIPAVRRWPDPPRDIRVDDGVSERVDRCRALGNAVVPSMAAFVGEAVKSIDRSRSSRVEEAVA